MASLLKRQLILLLATGFYSGYGKWMPGTLGSLVGVLIYGLTLQFLPLQGMLIFLLGACVLGVSLCGRAELLLGRGSDPKSVVFDEMVGMWIALLGLEPRFTVCLLAFVLFRFLDIAKPWPIGFLDRRFHGGLGIMLDDIAAGLITMGLLHGLQFFYGPEWLMLDQQLRGWWV